MGELYGNYMNFQAEINLLILIKIRLELISEMGRTQTALRLPGGAGCT